MFHLWTKALAFVYLFTLVSTLLVPGKYHRHHQAFRTLPKRGESLGRDPLLDKPIDPRRLILEQIVLEPLVESRGPAARTMPIKDVRSPAW